MNTLQSSLNFSRFSVGKLAWVCFLSGILFCGLPAQAQATMTILQAVWTDGINNKNQPRSEYNRVASTNSLYLWMIVKDQTITEVRSVNCQCCETGHDQDRTC